MHYIDLVPDVKASVQCNNTIVEMHSYSHSLPIFDLWHYCLGHLSSKRLPILIEKCPQFKFALPSSHTCDICQFAKQKHLSYSLSSHKASKIFELIQLDIQGPSSTHGHRYFPTVLDDFSRYTWVFFLIFFYKNQNTKVSTRIKDFIIFTKSQFDSSVKIVRADNGLEFNLVDFIHLEELYIK